MDPSYAAHYAKAYRNGPCAHAATPEALPRTESKRTGAGQAGKSHIKAWRAVRELGQTHCPYCRNKFTRDCPPTFDHKVPKALGGTLDDGIILACQSCNSARGDSPYEEYMAAVTEEWRLAKLAGRGYRRPKRIDLPGGGKIVLALSKKERRAFKVQARASFRNDD